MLQFFFVILVDDEVVVEEEDKFETYLEEICLYLPFLGMKSLLYFYGFEEVIEFSKLASTI